MIFLAENLLVTILALLFGWLVLKLNHKPIKAASRNEIFICILTNFINTAITYTGFWLWQHGYILFSYNPSWRIIFDFLVLFMLMDLAMFLFHYADPIPIDLFVLHPLETVGFGSLWLMMILLFSFNFYAVFIYLVVNVFFGIMGHLGIEPIPAGIRKMAPFKYLGTSSFHHQHHLNINHNFGFYTNIWDKIFKTYKGFGE